ncbi:MULTISPECIES: hypothetical protein [Trichocoleus]|uniref:Uncharacterized protein n=1 Tax=Trichocoleus desertorum GB2-A4 TaxID=2933944 RepID=A0ABV0JCU8_9CYAN|nr:hypothetical protein [Trichocoleus sp. FACHB-46]MBD1864256.1 hypothetical protein [Trichocoleus sp. FACHB-46]
MQRGQRVYIRDSSNPLSRNTLLFVEERDSLNTPNQKVVVVHVKEWGRNMSLWQQDIQESDPTPKKTEDAN